MNYRREIDGLRALAVLPVILFHAGFPAFRGGFVGVDVFFVISGYLITSIIVVELEVGRFSIVKFYERRARRILPALFLVMFVCLPFAWLWMLPDYANEFFDSLAAVSVFSSNVLFWQESGYFATAAELKPLLHTWSLAVEEQHYVLFPIFLLLTWRLGKRWVLGLLATVLVVSLATAQWGSVAEPAAAFFLLPTRGWELLIGALVAFYLLKGEPTNVPRAAREVAGAVGIALIAYAIFAFDQETPFPGLYALVPTVGTALIIACATTSTVTGRFLGNTVFVGIGLVSYSAYLWHLPLFVFARHRSVEEPTPLLLGFLAVASLALAHLSWRYVEVPFRKKGTFTRKHVFSFALAGSVFFAFVGVLQHSFSDQYQRLWLAWRSTEVRSVAQIITASQDNIGINSDGSHGDGECRFDVGRINAELEERIRSCHAKYGEGVVILGDSHAIDLFGVALAGSQVPFIVGVTQGGCRPHTPGPDCQYAEFLSFVERLNGLVEKVIYEQAGFYLLRTEEQRGNRAMFASLPMRETVEGVFIDEEHVRSTYQYLRDLSRQVDVVWFGSRIEPHIGENFMLKAGCDYSYQLRPNQREIFEGLDAYIRDLVKDEAAIRFVSQNEVMRFEFPRDYMNCQTLLWFDGDHFSASGERYFGSRVDVVSLATGRTGER